MRVGSFISGVGLVGREEGDVASAPWPWSTPESREREVRLTEEEFRALAVWLIGPERAAVALGEYADQVAGGGMVRKCVRGHLQIGDVARISSGRAYCHLCRVAYERERYRSAREEVAR